MTDKEYPEFFDMVDAFDYCREANRPVTVVLIPEDTSHKMYKLYPSGRADFIRVFQPTIERNIELEFQNAELLEALKAALESISNDPDIYWKEDTIADMQQAIAKAEGTNG